MLRLLLFTLMFSQMALLLLILFEFPLRKMILTRLDELNGGQGSEAAKMVATTVLVVLILSCIRSITMMMINRFLLELTLLGCSLFLALVIFRPLLVRRLETEIKQLEHELGTKKNDDEPIPTAPPYTEYADLSKGSSAHILKFPDYVPRISSLKLSIPRKT